MPNENFRAFVFITAFLVSARAIYLIFRDAQYTLDSEIILSYPGTINLIFRKYYACS